jgi:tetratricopeptide (TPR) repeat protein
MTRSCLLLTAFCLAPFLLQAQTADSLSEARFLVESGKLTEAEQVTRLYLQSHINSADAHFLLGYILFKQRRAEASLAEYTEGAKYRVPGAPELAAVAGDYVLLNDYADADKWFTKSVEWDPGNFQTLYYLARTKYNENRFEEAVAVFKQCLKLDPKNIKAEDNLGLSYQGLGKMDQALSAYQTAISWETGAVVRDSGPYIDMGSLLVDSGRPAEAVPYLLEAVRIAPQEVRGRRELGKAYLHLNQLESAQAELERSIELAPSNAPTHFVLAQVYRKRGLRDKAEAETKRYTELSAANSSPESLH